MYSPQSGVICNIELLDEDECSQLVASNDELFSELMQITEQVCNAIGQTCFLKSIKEM